MKPGDKVRYLGSIATVVERFWDDGLREWRLIIKIRQGKYGGLWGVREETVDGTHKH